MSQSTLTNEERQFLEDFSNFLTDDVHERILEYCSQVEETPMDKFIELLKDKGLPQVIETTRKYKKLGNNPMMCDLGKCEARMIVAIIQRKSMDEVLEIYEVCKAAVGKLTEIYDTHSENLTSDAYLEWMNMNKIYYDEIDWLKKEYLSCC